MSSKSCPPDEELQAFNEGFAGSSLISQIESHLADCDACINRLDNLPPGYLAEGIRRSYELSKEEVENASGLGQLDEDSEPILDWSKFTPSRHPSLGIEKYELVGEIGEGAMGKTFLAFDEDKQLWAVKIPHPGQMTSRQHMELFLKDAGLAYSLEHAHIVPVADFGRWQENLPYFASRHIKAPNLKRFSKTSFLANEKTLFLLFSQLCLAVDCAHKQNLMHRHLHPQNIFIEEGPKLVISEFCLHYDGRYQFELLQPLTQTSPFISPEAANNDPEFIDHRNDIFAIGKILKLMLKITPDLTPERRSAWAVVQDKCTRLRRRDRFQSVKELLSVVARSQQG